MLTIDYYSDILCVWAWISQRRIDELNKQFGDKIELRYHCIDVFGDTAKKMRKQWSERGSYEGFGAHVASAAANFKLAPVNPDIWLKTRPTTSANAHLFLKAIELSHSAEQSIGFALALRSAFFVNAQDISNSSVLFDLLSKHGMNGGPIKHAIDNGSAIAELMSDYQAAKELNIKGSPSYVMDGGRQTLYGNVGYRVLHANIEELIKQPEDEASWC